MFLHTFLSSLVPLTLTSQGKEGRVLLGAMEVEEHGRAPFSLLPTLCILLPSRQASCMLESSTVYSEN